MFTLSRLNSLWATHDLKQHLKDSLTEIEILKDVGARKHNSISTKSLISK